MALTFEQIEAIKTLQGWANYLSVQPDVVGVSDKVVWQIRNAIEITSRLVEDEEA